MTTPRTVAGQAAISAMRPYLKRALSPTIVAIEAEAIAPYLEALRAADRVRQARASFVLSVVIAVIAVSAVLIAALRS